MTAEIVEVAAYRFDASQVFRHTLALPAPVSLLVEREVNDANDRFTFNRHANHHRHEVKEIFGEFLCGVKRIDPDSDVFNGNAQVGKFHRG